MTRTFAAQQMTLVAQTLRPIARPSLGAFFCGARAVRPLFARHSLSRASSTATEHKDKAHGSYHWTFERSLAVVSLPLVASAAVLGPTPGVDFLLGFVLPMHCYFGFESMLVDYVHERKYGVVAHIAMWALRITTGIVMYGCFVINTSDVGLTALAHRLWTGKE